MKVYKCVKAFFVFIFFTIILHGCTTSHSTSSKIGSQEPRDELAINEFINALRKLRIADEYPVRVYYHGNCTLVKKRYFDTIPFPFSNLNAPSVDGGYVERVHSMFAKTDSVKVYIDEKKIVRVHIGNSIDYPLATKLSSVKIPSDAQYYPQTSAAYISTSSEFVNSMKQFDLQATFPRLFSGALSIPTNKSPRMPENLTNVTVDEALDMVAEKFRKIVIFSTCDTHYSVRVH